MTTWEALWMGCPVVAKIGTSVSGRVSAAILASLGLGDWVAETDEDYVATAVAKAREVEGVASLRGRLRALIGASAAGNPDLYARAVGDAYRMMWRRWCGG